MRKGISVRYVKMNQPSAAYKGILVSKVVVIIKNLLKTQTPKPIQRLPTPRPMMDAISKLRQFGNTRNIAKIRSSQTMLMPTKS